MKNLKHQKTLQIKIKICAKVYKREMLMNWTKEKRIKLRAKGGIGSKIDIV
jgi:hypothetical protein